MNPMRRHPSGATTEYIFILTLLLGVLLIVFWGKISRVVKDKVEDAGYGITHLKKRPGESAPEETSESESAEGSSGTGNGTGWSGGSWGGSGTGGIPTTPPTPVFVSSDPVKNR